MDESEPVSEFLVRLLENPRGELSPDDIRRVQEALASSAVPEGLEKLLEAMVEFWSRLVELAVHARIAEFTRGDCKGVGVDVDVCLFVRRLIEAYKALLSGQVIIDEAGRIYVKLLKPREVRGRILPRGAVTSVELGLGLLLYAIGDVELASIKPLKARLG